MARPSDNLNGKTFGHLKVLRRFGHANGRTVWLCKCLLCGRTRVVQTRYLRSGDITACKECSRRRERKDYLATDATVSVNNLRADDPYQHLANAIVAVAADDYRNALRRGDNHAIETLERFFLSDWYGVLTAVSGKFLIVALRQEFEQKMQKEG